MATEIFDQKTFERTLPLHKDTKSQMWRYFGFHQNEHCYLVDTRNENFFIFVRSSVDGTGFCGSTGENSIRIYLTDINGAPLSNKAESYITRVKGWQNRLTEKLRFWYALVSKATKANQYVDSIFQCKKPGPNEGRFFFRVGENFGEWLT